MENRIQKKDTQEHQTEHKKWTTFRYFSPLITNNNTNSSGIYKLQCNTCKMAYIGQSGRPIATRYKEHIRYIRNNSPHSAYAMHILQNRHEYGPAKESLQLLKECSKGAGQRHQPLYNIINKT